MTLLIPAGTGVLTRSRRRWHARCRMGRSSNGCTRHAAGRRDAQEAGEEGKGPHSRLTAEQLICEGTGGKRLWMNQISNFLLVRFTFFRCFCTTPLVWNAIFQSLKDVFWRFRERRFGIGLTKVFNIILLTPWAPALPVSRQGGSHE